MLENTSKGCSGGIKLGFFLYIRNINFQKHQWAFVMHFFSLTGTYQTRIYLFVSLLLQKIRSPLLFSDKVKLENCLTILEVSQKFYATFQNLELLLCSNDQMLESLTYNFSGTCTPSQVLLKQFNHKFRATILKNIFWWLLLKVNIF